jgi:glutathione synthase/RimK-type ligase-like ATP-grasp enzyme
MILIATCRAYPEPTPSARLLIDALAARGLTAELRIWTDTPADGFAAADLVLPLCCWDYHADPRRFAEWIDELDRFGARLVNSPRLLRWNFRKTYLLEMAARGFAVPRTLHLPAATGAAVALAMNQEGWSTAILKPVSSQSGHGVIRLDIEHSAT